ncbi:MAG TPA: hypothetical protein VMK84_03895, partial [Streptosporangiaceae bacterium]|nr:hypothetical protein [Streptosporangiaceae bacterium]
SAWSSSRKVMELRVDSGMAGMCPILPRGGTGPDYDPVPGERITSLTRGLPCRCFAPCRLC